MENLSKLVLFKIALNSDLPELTTLCQTSKRLNEQICFNQVFWMKRLSSDFDIYNDDIPNKYKIEGGLDYKNYYKFIINVINNYCDKQT